MNRKLCAPADKAQSWKSIDWKKAEAYVKKLQMRIVKAQKGGHYNKVKSLTNSNAGAISPNLSDGCTSRRKTENYAR